ncbi:MAG: hypothetical protein KBC95_05200 [Candidatus Peribacteraceae bacterium]|nr:hypothetical protein [Candidatus Peribacteraceae bacterium]
MDTNTPITPHDFGASVLEWEGRIQPLHRRSKRWYITAAVVVLGVTAISIITGAWSVALVTLLCGGLYVLSHDHAPAPRRLVAYEHGIVFDGAYRTWNEFRSFWFLRTPTYTELHLERADGRQPIIIQTGPIHPDRVKQVFSAYIPEDTQKTENILETLSRICKL